MSTSLKEALKRIEELEKENAKLKDELDFYKGRKLAGRQKHDGKWMQSYNAFVQNYEVGLSMTEIVEKSGFSRRTAYRYKAYYEEIQKARENDMEK